MRCLTELMLPLVLILYLALEGDGYQSGAGDHVFVQLNPVAGLGLIRSTLV